MNIARIGAQRLLRISLCLFWLSGLTAVFAQDDYSPLIMRRMAEMAGSGRTGQSRSTSLSTGESTVVKALTGETDSGELSLLNEINKKKDKLVHIAVEVVEIRNEKARTLGIKWVDTVQVGELSYKLTERVPETLTDIPALFTIGEFARWTSLQADIKFLVSKGAARLLAKPKLIAKSGTNAFFHLGGEVPIPLQSGFGEVSLEWKEYGTRVYLLPTVIDKSQIGLSIFTEVSDIDPTKGIVSSNLSVPGIITRKASSSVILNDGETLALAGLEKNYKEDTTQGIPLLCDIPIIGHLFSHKYLKDEKTTVVMFITPTIVKEGMPADKPAK